MAPSRNELNFHLIIFKQILTIDSWAISCEIALRLMSLDFIDDMVTLVQIMAWYHQTSSHYLSHCWPDLCHHMASLGHNEIGTQAYIDGLVQERCNSSAF